MIGWRFPPSGWHKLNSDGASKGNPGAAGYGGLIRNCSGNWMIGYATPVDICNALLLTSKVFLLGFI